MLAIKKCGYKIWGMDNNFYRELWFTLRGLERLFGINRNSLCYRLRRLEEYGAIYPRNHKKVLFRHDEGDRKVVRAINIYDIFATRELANTYDTIRAKSIVNRCDDIIKWNDDADYSNVKSRIID